MIFLSIFLYLFVSIVISQRWHRILRFSDLVIQFFIVTVGVNILVVQSLHFLQALDSIALFLLFQLLYCSLIVLILADPAKKIFSEPLPRIKFAPIKLGGIEAVLIFLMGIVLITAFYIGTLSPINNSDSLHTHLPRIYYWIQHASLESWFTVTETQIFYPINISIQGLWLFLLSGTEKSFFIIMWLALLAGVVLVHQIAKLLGINNKGALIASMVSLSFPVVLLHTYSYQGDLFVTTLIMCATYYLLLHHKQSDNTAIYASVISLIIAIGSKQTAIMFIPVYIIGVLLVIVINKDLSLRRLSSLVTVAVVGFLLFSSFKFIQNSHETIISESNMIDPRLFNHLLTMGEKPIEGYFTNSLRYLYQAVSLDGINGELRVNLEITKIAAFKKFTGSIGIDLESQLFLPSYEGDSFSYNRDWPINEDGSWYGPLSIILIPLSIIIAIGGKNKTRRVYLGLAFLTVLVFSFGQVVLKADGWGANRGRHMMIAALTIAPLVGLVVPKKRILNGTIALLIGLISFYLSLSVLLINDNRPLITTNSLYGYLAKRVNTIEVSNLLEAQFVSKSEANVKSLLLTSPNRKNIVSSDYYNQLFYQNTEYVDDILMVNSQLEKNEPLYLSVDHSIIEYALFGRNQTRELFPVRTLGEVPPSSKVLVDRTILEEQHLKYVIIAENEDFSLLFIP